MLHAGHVGTLSSGCVVSDAQRIALTNVASPLSPHRSSSFPSKSAWARRSDGQEQIMRTSVRIHSASNLLTQTAPRHASCFSACPPRTYSDLVSARKCSSNVVRLASHSPCLRREACHDVARAEGTDQTGKACDENSCGSSLLVNSHEVESGVLQVNLDSKLNALEQTLLKNAKLQSLAWQADLDSRLLALEQDQRDCANKVAMFEDMEDAKQQSLAWQAGFDKRLLTLEQHKQDDANKVEVFGDRLSVIEECIATLLELGEIKGREHTNQVAQFQERLSVMEKSTANFLKLSESKDQQHFDLKREVAKLKTVVSELEENLGLTSVPEAIDPKSVEQKRHNNTLTVPPEDRRALLIKSVGGISLAHDREHVLQQEPDQQTIPTTTLTHRLCVVECNIDMIASILKHIEDKFSNLNDQVLTSSEARSTRGRFMKKRSAGKCNSRRDKIWVSQEACEPYGTAHETPDAVPLGITDLENTSVNDQQSRMQLLLARANKRLDEAVPLWKCTLSQTFPTIMEEPDIAAVTPSD